MDIGAIEFIHQQIVALRDRGKAILLISVELDEILSLSDRVVVMFDGEIMGEKRPEDTNEKELRLLALEMALEDLDKIIANMKEKNYPPEQLNEYVKKRWNMWNEIYQVKQQ